MPDLTGFKEMGFTVRTYNGDLYVEKVTENYKVRFSQGFEPFHPTLREVVDFEIPDGLILVEFLSEKKELPKAFLEEIGQLFQSHYIRENYFFLFNARMDFGSPSINVKVKKLIDGLDLFYKEN